MSYCLSKTEWTEALAALRPRGEAWRNGDFDGLSGSVMGQFFAGTAACFAAADARLCDLANEFFCSTAVETRDLWALEYGLPDGCDPFADVCEKVNAVGDTTPEYVIAAALRRGWSITINQVFVSGIEDCVAGCGLAGAMICGASQGVAWFFTVDLAASPSYVASAGTAPLAGLMLSGDSLDCPPDIGSLTCLVRRIAPAHADLDFVTVN
jgi:uncharacterized protein YmfQ (DUF2313 family)